MHKPIQISIPSPCSEDWNNMTPKEQGRFCDSCQKCVVDFTAWTDKQIYEYITHHKNQKICGRFQTTQLNRTINIPPQPHSLLYKYFIGLGLTLIFTQIPIEQLKAKTPYTYSTTFPNDGDNDDNENIDSISVKIVVKDYDNLPIANAIIHIHRDDKLLKIVMSDKHGHVKLHLKQEGIYKIEAQANGYYDMLENIKINKSNHGNIRLFLQKPFIGNDTTSTITGDTILKY